jgi:hypothetical protein
MSTVIEKYRLFLLFILTANEFLPGGSGATIIHNAQITHITQNNTPHSNKTQHTKTAQTKDALHTMNTMKIRLNCNKYNYNYNYINQY